MKTDANTSVKMTMVASEHDGLTATLAEVPPAHHAHAVVACCSVAQWACYQRSCHPVYTRSLLLRGG